MMQTMKRGLALLLVLIMCLALVPTLFVATSAAEVNYVYDGKYIYNWGVRGTTATFLSPNAEDFYEENATSYESLSANKGGTGKSDAPSSALYKALQTLMKSNHDYINAYGANNSLLKYTDCQNSGGKISSFYSGKEIGPSWDSGSTWNKEHTWPNSKGLEGSDEDDIMMIRPTSVSENSSRGNTAYGQSSGYYNPNKESGGKYDLRGDVARIFLYVYVRWGNTGSKAWGTGGVMESVEVLLEWMEADPVDTWELGRNDSVESITGTRNVFVDYPEFAFLLFGEEIPADMSTPSGQAGGSGEKCNHNNFGTGTVVAPTCTEKGYTLFVCQTAGCGYSYKDKATNALSHNYTNGTCTTCGAAEPVLPTYVTNVEVGKAYKLGLLYTPEKTEYFFSGTIINNYYGSSDSSYANGVDVYLEQAAGGYYLYFKNSSNQKQYINVVASGTYRNFTLSSTASTVFTWDSSKNTLKTTVSGNVCYIGNYGTYSSFNILTDAKLKDTDYIARFYTIGDGTQDKPSDNPTCQHTYSSVVTKPSCTNEGYTTYTCSQCKHSYTSDKVASLGHNYTNGTCTRCGAVKPSQTELTIRFNDTANRTAFSTTQQVWEMNGITVTNDKGSATSNVADYSDPVRFYQGSNVTISYPGMTKIVIDCSGLDAKYVDSWLNVTGGTATKSGGIVTVVLDAPTDSVTYIGLAKQSRAYSITVYAENQEPDTQECTHANTTIEGAIEATCSSEGCTGTVSCLDCGAVLAESEVIPATDHVFAAWVVIRTPNCTVDGLERRDCDNCTHYETTKTPASGHIDEDSNEICDVCEEMIKNTPTPPETPDDGNTNENEQHVCGEVGGFKAFINAIINFFRRLLGQPELCPCGETILNKEN